MHFKVQHSWEVLEAMWRYWGGFNECPSAKVMAAKAREWEEKYETKLVEIAHDWLVFRTKNLTEKEAGELWEDVCKIAPNSRDIVKDGIKRLLECREVALWWD